MKLDFHVIQETVFVYRGGEVVGDFHKGIFAPLYLRRFTPDELRQIADKLEELENEEKPTN